MVCYISQWTSTKLFKFMPLGTKMVRLWGHVFYIMQLIAQFRIWPRSDLLYSVIANYTSAVIFKKTYFGFVLLYNYPLYVCESKNL